MIKLTLYIILLLSFSLTSYGNDDNIIIATIPLDKTLKEDNDLRIMLLNTIKEYSFLKQIHLIKIDRKIKKLYKNKAILNIEDAINVSRELKLDVAIILHKEKRLVVVTNDIATNTNTAMTNEPSIKPQFTNHPLINVDTTNTTTTNDTITSNENIFTTIYFVQGIDIETEKSIYSNEAGSADEVNTLTRELINIIGLNYSRNMLDKIESPNSDIDLDFGVNIINDNNTKTTLTNNSNIYVSDKLEFNFTANKDGFITILGFLSDNSMLILNPNDFSEVTNVVSNESYRIPSDDAVFDIIASGANGIDEYYIIFTKEAPDFVTDTKYVNGTGFKSINKASIPEYSKLIRDDLKKEKDWYIQKIKLNLNELIIIKKGEISENSVYRRYY